MVKNSILLTVVSSEPETIYSPLGSTLIVRIISVWPINTILSTVGKGCRSLGDGNFGIRYSASMVNCRELWFIYILLNRDCFAPTFIRLARGHKYKSRQRKNLSRT